ncbi:MAG: PUA domain-containing protein [Promethearchaeota archaeon]
MIINNIKKPILRIVVQNDIAEFIAEGRNVFCKHVVDIDENLRPNDEVIIVNENDELLAVGRLKIPVSYIKSFKSGVAVNVRRGIKSLKN